MNYRRKDNNYLLLGKIVMIVGEMEANYKIDLVSCQKHAKILFQVINNHRTSND